MIFSKGDAVLGRFVAVSLIASCAVETEPDFNDGTLPVVINSSGEGGGTAAAGGGTAAAGGGGTCNATTCPGGCCDTNGNCQRGTDLSACGTGGRACFACRSGQSCEGGFCSNTCGTSGHSCATAKDCCPNLTCPRFGITCTLGNVGDPCSSTTQCLSGLTCNGLWCTKQCTSDAQCSPASSTVNACVQNQAGTRTCFPAGCNAPSADCSIYPGATCINDNCSVPTTPCSGCFANGVCQQGSTNLACGKGGGFCSACPSGTTCNSGGKCVASLGAPCSSSIFCDTGLLCVTDWSGVSTCKQTCNVDSSCGSSCPSGDHCYYLGTVNSVQYRACLPADPVGAVCGGCNYGPCAAGLNCVAPQADAGYGYCFPSCNPQSPSCAANLSCTSLSNGMHACFPTQAMSMDVCTDLCNIVLGHLSVTNLCGLCNVAIDQIAQDCNDQIPYVGGWVCTQLGNALCQWVEQNLQCSTYTCSWACGALGL